MGDKKKADEVFEQALNSKTDGEPLRLLGNPISIEGYKKEIDEFMRIAAEKAKAGNGN